MAPEDTAEVGDHAKDKSFQTTHWSVVLAATRAETSQSQDALAKLCEAYWYPLYAHVRRRGYNAEDAQDLTQEFFARLLARGWLKFADQTRGKFRSFLLKSLEYFLVNDWVHRQAQKRGGGNRVVSLQEEQGERIYAQQPTDQLTPDGFCDKSWAVTLIQRAMDRLRTKYTAAGRGALFEQLKDHLLSETSEESYQRIAERLGLSPGAVKVALHRLRQRFGAAVRAEIAQTVDTPEAVDEELRCLMAALSSKSQVFQ